MRLVRLNILLVMGRLGMELIKDKLQSSTSEIISNIMLKVIEGLLVRKLVLLWCHTVQ